jgi:hypothetical protein
VTEMENPEILNFLKRNFANMIIETDLKLVEDAFASENVESDAEPFRESNRSSNVVFTNLYGKVLNIDRDKASIAYYNHLRSPNMPVYPDTTCIIDTQNREGCPGICKNPDSMIKIVIGIIGRR